MKGIKMENVALMMSNGGLAIVIGDNERSIMRMMQLINAEDEDDVIIFELGDSEDMEDW